MSPTLFKALLFFLLLGAAAAEPLDHRYGPDHERGYRSDREYGEGQPGFKNRDRANFLGQNTQAPTPSPDEEFGTRPDIHRSPEIGIQR
jgi:hypothetical protein